jgi:hypothetical protein
MTTSDLTLQLLRNRYRCKCGKEFFECKLVLYAPESSHLVRNITDEHTGVTVKNYKTYSPVSGKPITYRRMKRRMPTLSTEKVGFQAGDWVVAVGPRQSTQANIKGHIVIRLICVCGKWRLIDCS